MNIYSENIFNDQYADAKPVHQNFHDIRNNLFTRKQSETAQLNEIVTISGTMEDFKVNRRFNSEHGLPDNTYSFQTSLVLFPYFKRKKFHDTYGKDGSLVTLLEVLQNPSLFSRRIRFKINGYMIMDIAFSSNNTGTTIILQPKASKFYQSTLDDFITGKVQWDLIVEPVTSYGTVTKEKSLLFQNGNMIRLSDITMNKLLNVESVNKYWIVSIACGFSDPGVFVHTIGETVTVGEIKYISIPEKFKTFIYSQTSICNVYVFAISDNNNPISIDTSTSNGHYITNTDYSILDPSCVSVESFNTETSVIGGNIDTSSLTFQYPNIYSSADIFNIKNPLILMRFNMPVSYVRDSLLCNEEVIQYDPTQFPLIDYIAKYKKTNGLDQSLPSIVKNYIPYKLSYSVNDFISSQLNGDFNQYMLNKLIAMLHDYPKRYCKLYNTINEKYRYFHYLQFFAKTAPHVLNTSLLNNVGEIHDEDFETLFDEPQCYVSFNNSSGMKKEVNIYVDGLRIPTKYSFTNGFTQYVYIPVSKVTPNSIIELEVLRDYDHTIYSGDITFPNIDERVSLPFNFKGISSADSIFYNKLTGSYISKSNINFSTKVYKVDIYMIDDPEKRRFFAESIGDYLSSSDIQKFTYYTSEEEVEQSVSYFKTILEEFYLTSNKEKILLAEDIEIVNHTSSNNFYKILDSSRCFVSTNKIEYASIPIGIATTKFFTSIYGIIRNVDGKRSLTLEGFKGEPSGDRFRVFLNGILLDPSEYELILPSKYNSTVTVNYKNIPEGLNIGIVDYLPIKLNRDLVSIDIVDPKYISIKKPTSYLPISSRDMLFINGKKYPQDCGILDITSNRTLISNVFGNDNTCKILSFQQKHDPDVYGFSSSVDIDDKLMDSDVEYLKFQINSLVSKLYDPTK